MLHKERLFEEILGNLAKDFGDTHKVIGIGPSQVQIALPGKNQVSSDAFTYTATVMYRENFEEVVLLVGHKKVAKYNLDGKKVHTRLYWKQHVLKSQRIYFPRYFPPELKVYFRNIDKTITAFLEPVSVSFIRSLTQSV